MVRMEMKAKEDEQRGLRMEPGRHRSELDREGSDCVQASDLLADQGQRVEWAVRLAGEFSSGSKDVSTEHDRYLGEAFDITPGDVETSVDAAD
ncbi:MAG: hypothetical protein C0504_16190 [Candidatus Solibacter sp.]|nr:hypothetical protein [Candidatus Solibacter sp.]